MFVINSDSDGVQYAIVSLSGYPQKLLGVQVTTVGLPTLLLHQLQVIASTMKVNSEMLFRGGQVVPLDLTH